MSLHMSVHMCMATHMSIYISMHMSVHMSLHMATQARNYEQLIAQMNDVIRSRDLLLALLMERRVMAQVCLGMWARGGMQLRAWMGWFGFAARRERPERPA